MDLSRMNYLLAVQKLGGKCSLGDLWNCLADYHGKLPDFKLVLRGFYRVVQSLEQSGLIVSKSDRSDVHYFPAKLISITAAGSDRIKIYSRILPELIPTDAKDQSSKGAERKLILSKMIWPSSTNRL